MHRRRVTHKRQRLRSCLLLTRSKSAPQTTAEAVSRQVVAILETTVTKEQITKEVSVKFVLLQPQRNYATRIHNLREPTILFKTQPRDGTHNIFIRSKLRFCPKTKKAKQVGYLHAVELVTEEVKVHLLVLFQADHLQMELL